MFFSQHLLQHGVSPAPAETERCGFVHYNQSAVIRRFRIDFGGLDIPSWRMFTLVDRDNMWKDDKEEVEIFMSDDEEI